MLLFHKLKSNNIGLPLSHSFVHKYAQDGVEMWMDSGCMTPYNPVRIIRTLTWNLGHMLLHINSSKPVVHVRAPLPMQRRHTLITILACSTQDTILDIFSHL